MSRYSLARLTGQKYQGGNPIIPIGFSTCQRSDPLVGLEQILCADKVEVVLEEFRLQDGLKTELLESDGRYVSRLAMLRDNTGGSIWSAHDWPSGVPVAFVQLEPELRENIFELVSCTSSVLNHRLTAFFAFASFPFFAAFLSFFAVCSSVAGVGSISSRDLPDPSVLDEALVGWVIRRALGRQGVSRGESGIFLFEDPAFNGRRAEYAATGTTDCVIFLGLRRGVRGGTCCLSGTC